MSPPCPTSTASFRAAAPSPPPAAADTTQSHGPTAPAEMTPHLTSTGVQFMHPAGTSGSLLRVPTSPAEDFGYPAWQSASGFLTGAVVSACVATAATSQQPGSASPRVLEQLLDPRLTSCCCCGGLSGSRRWKRRAVGRCCPVVYVEAKFPPLPTLW